MNVFKSAIFGIALSCSAQAGLAQVVITGHGVFTDCNEAWSYREGPLLNMLDGAFEGHDADVEARIKDTIAKFEQHRADAEAAYAAADADQKKRIAMTIGKWAFAQLVGNMKVSQLPDSITKHYSPEQLAVFEQVINTSNKAKSDIAASIATGNPPDNFLSEQGANLAIDILSRFAGPAGPFLSLVGTLPIDLAKDYWETQPIKDVAQKEADIFAQAVLKMHAKSKDSQIAEINAVKNEIDAACGQ